MFRPITVTASKTSCWCLSLALKKQITRLSNQSSPVSALVSLPHPSVCRTHTDLHSNFKYSILPETWTISLAYIFLIYTFSYIQSLLFKVCPCIWPFIHKLYSLPLPHSLMMRTHTNTYCISYRSSHTLHSTRSLILLIMMRANHN